MAKLANRFLTTQQIGFLLGYLGHARARPIRHRAAVGRGATPGKLLFVEENIRATAASLGVPLDDFRVWIALHETTHAFEFEANAWLRPYLRDRLERQLTACSTRRAASRPTASAALIERCAASRATTRLPRFLAPEQRVLFEETQLVMSLLEGFSDWVMDEVGAQVVARRDGDPRALRGAPRASGAARRPSHGPPDRPRPEARAVPARRAVRVRRGRGRRRDARSTLLWSGPYALPERSGDGRPGGVGAPRVAPTCAVRDAAAQLSSQARDSGPADRSGPDGVPAAIALSPILSARYRQQDLERIAAAAPGSRARERLARGSRRQRPVGRRSAAPRAAARRRLRPAAGALPAPHAGSTRRRPAWSAC